MYRKENEWLREDKEKMNEGVVTKTNGCEMGKPMGSGFG
jgi:hypothetical protein